MDSGSNEADLAILVPEEDADPIDSNPNDLQQENQKENEDVQFGLIPPKGIYEKFIWVVFWIYSLILPFLLYFVFINLIHYGFYPFFYEWISTSTKRTSVDFVFTIIASLSDFGIFFVIITMIWTFIREFVSFIKTIYIEIISEFYRKSVTQKTCSMFASVLFFALIPITLFIVGIIYQPVLAVCITLVVFGIFVFFFVFPSLFYFVFPFLICENPYYFGMEEDEPEDSTKESIHQPNDKSKKNY